MERKYQVFISSTYTDLKNERQSIINFLLMANCIPAGMEAFIASDDEQFSIIKKVIDLCDFYILVIGNRYGSVNEKTGISYTEMEYEYAVSKGIPVLAFVKSNYSDGDSTENDESKDKLKKFCEKVMKNRMCSMWTTSSDLNGKVSISIMTAINEGNRPGWVRNLGFDPENMTNEINALRERIIQLEKENKALKDSGAFASLNEETDKGIPKLSQYKLSLHFTENRMVYYTGMPPAKEMNIELDLEQIFKFISVRISGTIDDKRFIKELSEYVEGFDVDKQQALIVKNQLITLGLLEEVEIGLFVNVRLSQLGKRVMKHLNAPEKR